MVGVRVNGSRKRMKIVPKSNFLYKKKDREEFLKMGKKYKNPMWIESAKKRYVYRDMTAASFEQIKTHLIKTCKSIKLLD